MDLLEFIRTFCTKLGTPSSLQYFIRLNESIGRGPRVQNNISSSQLQAILSFFYRGVHSTETVNEQMENL